ncbi:glycosyl hydrolase family 16 [bacterium CG_4_9_14_3_um_filter_65_15]|nr:MAG: glycosyl hydrolase family 16 [bacterium CG_4_9_14_3_um_filter_65_15]
MTMRTLMLTMLAAGYLALTAGCREETPVPVYGLIWSDEFEGPAGQLPSSGKWIFDTGTDWGNNQLEWDTDLPTNVSLDGQGNLAITARREEFSGQSYTSGRIKTKGLFERRYGRFEARIKLPVGQGIWPAFWMLGNDIDGVHWPNCGEIDIMEYRGQEPQILHGSVHGPGYSGDGALTKTHVLGQGGFTFSFHEFAVEWSPQGIIWFIDGYAYHTVTSIDLPAGTNWVFDHPFFLLLNLAVGGDWVGPPDITTEFPQTMLVDYVRVYGEK